MSFKLNHIVEELVLELHSQKGLMEFIAYAKKHMASTVELTKNGYRFCPPFEMSPTCYTAHKNDNALPELYRFYSKVYNVKKQEVENAFKNKRQINLEVK